jgi:hypothetical protein
MSTTAGFALTTPREALQGVHAAYRCVAQANVRTAI